MNKFLRLSFAKVNKKRKMTKYSDTIKYLYSALPMFHRIGNAAYKVDINNTVELMKSLGNPYLKFHSVHIAGTNGKGSTSHFIASILKESGVRTGLHTSPHLKDLRERIVVDGKMCSKQYVSGFIQRYTSEIERIQPSFFEIMVAMAFKYFEKKKVDTAVVEVGMGGRLDSTNVITPEVSLITNISFDHTQFLGDTIEKIAQEKAGIIKESVPVVISQTQREIKHVFIQKAQEKNAPIYFADERYSVSNVQYMGNKLVFDVYREKELFLERIQCPLSGEYQLKNILGVLQTIEVLNKSGKYSINKEDIKRGIENLMKNFPLNGRWQEINSKPRTLCDTGHNEDGLQYVLHQLKKEKYDKLRFVFGVVNDKDIDKEISMLPKDAVYYLCQANIPRALDVNILEKKMKDAGFVFKVYKSVKRALRMAQKDAEKSSANDLVFVGGSTYTVAEIV